MERSSWINKLESEFGYLRFDADDDPGLGLSALR